MDTVTPGKRAICKWVTSLTQMDASLHVVRIYMDIHTWIYAWKTWNTCMSHVAHTYGCFTSYVVRHMDIITPGKRKIYERVTSHTHMTASRHVSWGTRGYDTPHISADAVVLPARGIPSYAFVMSGVTHSCGDTTRRYTFMWGHHKALHIHAGTPQGVTHSCGDTTRRYALMWGHHKSRWDKSHDVCDEWRYSFMWDTITHMHMIKSHCTHKSECVTARVVRRMNTKCCTFPYTCGNMNNVALFMCTFPCSCAHSLIHVHIPLFMCTFPYSCAHSLTHVHIPLFMCTFPYSCAHSLIHVHIPLFMRTFPYSCEDVNNVASFMCTFPYWCEDINTVAEWTHE